jgi:hypothetical protein
MEMQLIRGLKLTILLRPKQVGRFTLTLE